MTLICDMKAASVSKPQSTQPHAPVHMPVGYIFCAWPTADERKLQLVQQGKRVAASSCIQGLQAQLAKAALRGF